MYRFIIIILLIFTACRTWNSIPYTNVEKLSSLKIGMSINEVNKSLELKPYDLYLKGENGVVALYNYRVKKRKMKVLGKKSSSLHNEDSQTKGEDWYAERYYCYIYFKNNKLKSIITDRGKLKSEEILIKNNSIYLIQKKKLGLE